jgi:hypothetical protein
MNKLYLDDGAGRFSEAPLPRRATPEETRDADLVDIDADGDLDAYFANVRIFNADRDRQDRLLLNDGGGTFADATERLVPDDEVTMSSVFLDVDGDGDLDLIRGTFGSHSGDDWHFPLSAFRNDGSGRFVPAGDVLPASAMANAFDIEVADYNGDGKPDLFVCSRGGPDRLLLAIP